MLPAGRRRRAYLLRSMSQDETPTASPFARARAISGVLCFLLVGVLAVIDSVSGEYIFELGPMMLLVGSGSVLLGVEITALVSRITRGP